VAGRLFEQLPTAFLERHAVATTHAHQAGVVEFGRQYLGLVLVDAQPLGNARDQGLVVRYTSRAVGWTMSHPSP
jgi:hypothetical protein